MLDEEYSCAVDAAIAAPFENQDGRGADAATPARGKRQAARPKPPKQPTPRKVLEAFNTWAFKREQPDDPQLMLTRIAEAMAKREPVSFVLYWGKGPRREPAEPDVECLDFLAALARRVRNIYAHGAAVTLIFTDTHARLNGHCADSMRAYFGAVERLARERGFDACWLGDLTRRAELAEPAMLADETVSPEVLRRLAACAAKWYRGEGTAEHGALKYYEMNMVEKRAVELAFPRSIFVTFNGSEFRSLFPQTLPIFHMYSLRRGVSVKPWFLPRPEIPSEARLAG